MNDKVHGYGEYYHKDGSWYFIVFYYDFSYKGYWVKD